MSSEGRVSSCNECVASLQVSKILVFQIIPSTLLERRDAISRHSRAQTGVSLSLRWVTLQRLYKIEFFAVPVLGPGYRTNSWRGAVCCWAGGWPVGDPVSLQRGSTTEIKISRQDFSTIIRRRSYLLAWLVCFDGWTFTSILHFRCQQRRVNNRILLLLAFSNIPF